MATKVPSPRETFLLSIAPGVPQGIVIGRCQHSCQTRVKMGRRKPVDIGRLYHYVCITIFFSNFTYALAQCGVCKLQTWHHTRPHSEVVCNELRTALAGFDAETVSNKGEGKVSGKRGKNVHKFVRRETGNDHPITKGAASSSKYASAF